LSDATLGFFQSEPDGEYRLRAEIEANLASGKWHGGTRLPTERALSTSFGIARSRVRRVLQEFEKDGRVTRTVGRGTFVTEQSKLGTISDEDIEMISPEDLIDVRLIVEPNMADLLVRRASAADLANLQKLLDKAKLASTMTEFEDHDHAFHMALAHATKNTYLIAVIARMQAVRRSRTWSAIRRRGVTASRQSDYQAQHEAILAALQLRDRDRLRQSLYDHLNEVRQNLNL